MDQQFTKNLSRVQRRLFLQRLTDNAPILLLLGALPACFLALASYLTPFYYAPYGAAACFVLSVVTALIIASTTASSKMDAAHAADRVIGHDRVLTALSLQKDPSDIAALQRTDAAKRLASLDMKTSFPLAAHPFISITALLLLSITLLFSLLPSTAKQEAAGRHALKAEAIKKLRTIDELKEKLEQERKKKPESAAAKLTESTYNAIQNTLDRTKTQIKTANTKQELDDTDRYLKAKMNNHISNSLTDQEQSALTQIAKENGLENPNQSENNSGQNDSENNGNNNGQNGSQNSNGNNSTQNDSENNNKNNNGQNDSENNNGNNNGQNGSQNNNGNNNGQNGSQNSNGNNNGQNSSENNNSNNNGQNGSENNSENNNRQNGSQNSSSGENETSSSNATKGEGTGFGGKEGSSKEKGSGNGTGSGNGGGGKNYGSKKGTEKESLSDDQAESITIPDESVGTDESISGREDKNASSSLKPSMGQRKTGTKQTIGSVISEYAEKASAAIDNKKVPEDKADLVKYYFHALAETNK